MKYSAPFALVRMLLLLAGTVGSAASQAAGQPWPAHLPHGSRGDLTEASAAEAAAPTTVADSLARDEARLAAERSTGRRLIISLQDRLLWWVEGSDTLLTAPVAIGKGTRLVHEGAEWEFSTPRGVRRVLGKGRNPTWVPPDWHYVELARDSALELVRLEHGPGFPLADGSRVVVRGDRIGRILRNGRFEPVPEDEEVIFGSRLFLPPIGTRNRQIRGELGAYKLDLGDGVLIHGTPHKASIGTAATHGCVRLRDGDLEYLFHQVAVGTPVYIY